MNSIHSIDNIRIVCVLVAKISYVFVYILNVYVQTYYGILKGDNISWFTPSVQYQRFLQIHGMNIIYISIYGLRINQTRHVYNST